MFDEHKECYRKMGATAKDIQQHKDNQKYKENFSRKLSLADFHKTFDLKFYQRTFREKVAAVKDEL